jgi:hypothetical protein
MVTAARVIVLMIEQSSTRRGAYKAALAYVALRRRFPAARRRQLEWAIRTAVIELP